MLAKSLLALAHPHCAFCAHYLLVAAGLAACITEVHQLERNISKAWTKRMPMLTTMRAPTTAEVTFHLLVPQ
jgi:hypothetical protein